MKFERNYQIGIIQQSLFKEYFLGLFQGNFKFLFPEWFYIFGTDIYIFRGGGGYQMRPSLPYFPLLLDHTHESVCFSIIGW